MISTYLRRPKNKAAISLELLAASKEFMGWHKLLLLQTAFTNG